MSSRAPASFLVIPLMVLAMLVRLHPASAEDMEPAKERFKAGVAFFAEENYPAALEAFEDSYRIVPKASVLFNIGMCQKALFRFADALATFERYLHGEHEGESDNKRATAVAAVAELEKMVGTLVVVDAPEGANISVDGEPVDASTVSSIVLDPGQHTVRVTGDGFEPMETSVTIASQAELSLRAPLVRAKGTIDITCTNAEAAVMVDGVVRGGCPYEGQAAPGEHTVSVSAPGMRVFQKKVTVTSGERAALTVILQPIEPRPAGRPATALSPAATEQPQDTPARNGRGLIVGGAISFTLGVGMGVVGGVFHHAASEKHQAGKQIEADMKSAAIEPTIDNWSTLKGDHDDIDAKLAVDNALMLAGYISGGVLLVTGTALLVVGMKRRHRPEDARVSVSHTGIIVRF